MDYIGIDAYFPLSEAKTPEVTTTVEAWHDTKDALRKLHRQWKKPILFTEYGYPSRDFAADGHWKHEDKVLEANQIAQGNAYEALYTAVWNEPYFAGGFLWKWFEEEKQLKRVKDTDFTPQGKAAEKVIQTWYGKK